jgi:GMP synthase (glutamine-hydrolysing)
MTRVLVLDIHVEPPVFEGPRWFPAGIDHEILWVLRGERPSHPRRYSHIVVSGSAHSILDSHDFVAPLETFLREASAAAVPIMGVCYGCQLVARAFLGPAHVRRLEAEVEAGWLPVEVTDEAGGWFAGLPRPFHTWHSHHDEVVDLPAGWRGLARTDRCAIQAYDHPELRLFGVQFHPEMDLESGNDLFRRDRAHFARWGIDVEGLVAAARDDGAQLLFRRFLERPASAWRDL